MMIDKDKILSIVRLKGPLIPRDLVKEIGGDTFFTGAVLSQLVESKELKISYAKIGGSPVYYIIGQESKLEKLYPYLNEKDKKAYDVLKERKILRDIECEPLLRVALRSIKDFAKPLEVTLNQNKELFWKWHLIQNQEAENLIKSSLGQNQKTIQQPQKEKEQTTEKPKQEVLEEPIKKAEQEPKKETQRPERKKEGTEIQEKIIEEPIDQFYEKLKKIFAEKGIIVTQAKVIRKNTDIELDILLNSKVGNINFYCRAKDKKRTNDKDLSSLYVDAQLKKMPVLYVTTGELTKKAEQMLSNEFKVITVMRI